MLIKKQLKKQLPLELNKWYNTKHCTGWKFYIIKIEYKKNTDIPRLLWGYYETDGIQNMNNLCPCDPERMIYDYVDDKIIEICEYCGKN